jgi:hypothetical protein
MLTRWLVLLLLCLPSIVFACEGVTQPPVYQLVHGDWGSQSPTMNAVYTFVVHKGALFAGGRVVNGSPTPTARLLGTLDGVNWTPVSLPFRQGDNEVRRLWSASNGYLYAVTQAGTPHLYRSRDGVTGWERVNAGLVSSDTFGRWFVEFQSALYLAVNTDSAIPARVIRAPLPAGRPWEEAGTAPATQVDAANSLYADASLIYVTTNNAGTNGQGGVFRSADGTSWSRINQAQFGDGTNIVHSLVRWREALWVGTQNTSVGGAIWSSGDQGVTWTKRSTDGLGIGPSEEEVYRLYPWGNWLLIGTVNRTDGGRVWATCDGDTYWPLGEPGFGGGSEYQGVFDFALFAGAVYTSQRVESVSTDLQTFPTAIILNQQ